MADEKVLNHLCRGSNHWNKWIANYINVTRENKIDLTSYEFEDLNLENFQFPIDVDFSNSKFFGKTNFSFAIFGGDVIFEKAEFSNCAAFETEESGCLHFERTQFNGVAHFNESSFEVKTSFIDCDFEAGANFRSCKFKFQPQLSEDRQKPISCVTFSGTNLGRGSDFRYAIFSDLPDFRGVKYDSVPMTEFGTIKYRNTKSPIMRDSRNRNARSFNFAMPASHYQDADIYRAIRKLCNDVKDHESELNFFAFEMKAKRWHEPNRLSLILNYLYEWLSNFGQSIALPCFWLVTLWISAFLWIERDSFPKTYFEPATVEARECSKDVGNSIVFEAVASFAITNSLVFLGGDKLAAREKATKCLYGKNGEGLSFIGHAFIILQSAFSLLLFFLIGLGLRNRFRIGGGS